MLYRYNNNENTDDYYCFKCQDDKYMVKKESMLEKELDNNRTYQCISDTAGHKKIFDLLEGNYKIPTYQRGYRWDSQNVLKLLEDIYEEKLIDDFDSKTINNILKKSNFTLLNKHVIDNESEEDEIADNYKYCIQPLVIMRRGRMNEYDVVDGQQRLTTIALILSALRFCKAVYGSTDSQNPIPISYDSRPGSKELLEFIWELTDGKSPEELKKFKNGNDLQKYIWKAFNNEKDIRRNIDFDHILNSFDVSVKYFFKIVEPFADMFGTNNVQRYYDYLWFVLTNCTEVIWYVVDKDNKDSGEIDERKIFANFNTGKLPLTNAELIKAMFMNPANYGAKDNGDIIKDRQIVIAEKWDAIETELHNPDFWAFVPHPNQFSDTVKDGRYNDTRIDVIFDFLVMKNWLKKNNNNIDRYIRDNYTVFLDKYYTFNEIEKWINQELKKAVEEQSAKESEKKIEKVRVARREVMDKCWDEVRNIFTSIKEFYDDDGRNSETSSKLYNLIGFYIYASNMRKWDGKFQISSPIDNESSNIDENVYLEIYGFLNELSKESRKNREKWVTDKIKKLLELEGKQIKKYIKDMEYKGENDDKIAILLLLYNIALLNKSGGIGNRFHFSEYAKQKWQREHIFAQNEDYLNDSNLVVERKAALSSLAKGIDNENPEAGLKENSFIQYINYINNYEIDYCPVGKDDDENTSTGVDKESIEAFEKRYKESTGYKMYYAKKITARKKAKMLIDMYGSIDDAKSIINKYYEYSSSRNKRLKEEFIDETIRYKTINTTFFKNISIDDKIISEYFIDKNIEKDLRQQSDTYTYFYDNFSIHIEDKLHINLGSSLKRIFNDFKSTKPEKNLAIEDFKNWLHSKPNETEATKKDIIHKQIEKAFIKKLKNILWFTIEGRNKIVDMIDMETDYQSIRKTYMELKVSAKKRKNDDLDEEELIMQETVSNTVDLDDNIENESEENESDDINNVESIKDKFNIIDIDIDIIMIAVNSNLKEMKQIIDDFFSKEYTSILNDNSMGNFTLLTREINASIGNKPYSEKCNMVYEKYKKGSFIPLGTIFVFTDLYTKGVNSATQWLPESRLRYLQDLIDTITEFFGGENA